MSETRNVVGCFILQPYEIMKFADAAIELPYRPTCNEYLHDAVFWLRTNVEQQLENIASIFVVGLIHGIDN
jgi:hypothetical protein